MMQVKVTKFIIIAIGLLLIKHGIHVINTGVLLNASIRGGILINVESYSGIVGGLLIFMGGSVCVIFLYEWMTSKKKGLF